MPRTAITVQSMSAFGGEIEDVSLTAADAANEMQFTHPGGVCFVLIDNASVGSLDVVFKSVSGPATRGMTQDRTVSTGAGEQSFIAIPSVGYDQGSGVVHIDIATDTSLTLGVFHIPNAF